jgi:putative tricarboxylic transport membrane protein
MDVLSSLHKGFEIAIQPGNIFYCFSGVFVGTLIGVLPGIGPGGTMAILLPLTFTMPPESAVIMLAGIYYGAQYGGSTTAILVNIPGEAGSVVTCLDGYQMARQGRAGPALGISAFGSFIGGTLSVVGMIFLAKPLSDLALRFGPPEYFAVMVLAMTLVVFLGRGSMVKALIMVALGVMLSFVGLDYITGDERFMFGSVNLMDGIGLVPLAMGLFGISEIFVNLETSEEVSIFKARVKNLLPNLKDWVDSIGAIIRGSILGFIVGVLPGVGTTASSFTSYTIEKKLSKHPEKFGTGVIEGVAGPETANNAASTGCLIPLFTLGIPTNVIMAMLFAALLIQGIQPGPLIIKEHPDIYWSLVVSLYVGNIMLLILNLPLIRLWVEILRIPYRILYPLIILFCLIGVYAINNNVYDIVKMIFFGFAGYVFKKMDYEPAPLLIAFVLAPMLERALRQSIIMSRGSLFIFLSRPISSLILLVALIILLYPLISFLGKKRKKLTIIGD